MVRTQELVERFFRYTAITSQSDASAKSLPSTPGQFDIARCLVTELTAMGLSEIVIDERAIVTARKKGTVQDAPTIGFVAHTDTFDAGLSPNVHAQIIKFTGENVCLNKEQDIWLKIDEHPEILAYQNQDIIFSDGTSVLGADNKAAVAVVMTMLNALTEDMQYGDIIVAFVPDEETGLRGAKVMDLDRFKVDFAYTIDCCQLGELVFETFNAATAKLHFTGVSAHPMSAKNVLINPLLMAMDFIQLFDRKQTPEHTENREGYIWFNKINADYNQADLIASIRDFSLTQFNERKQQLYQATEQIRQQYPRGKISIEITDEYSNISDAIGEDKTAIELMFKAAEEINVPAKVIPMRGGTDGSALSARGILTPNFFTGAHNFHSRFEFLPIPSFVKSLEMAMKIVEIAAR